MAPWGDAKLFLSFAFIACFCTVTLAQMPMDCCLSVGTKRVERFLIGGYRHQSSGNGCSIRATILVTKRGRMLCVPPDEPWVKKIVSHLNNLRKTCKRDPKNRHCQVLSPY